MLQKLQAKLDENLVYIWTDLMSHKARTLAAHALMRVLIGAALVIVVPYAIGFLIEGMTTQTNALLITGGVLFFTLKFSEIVIGWWRQQVRERFFQEEFWFLPQAITRRYFSRPLAWLAGGSSEIDGGGVESLRDKVWNVVNSYIFSIIPGYAQIGFGIAAISIANIWLGAIALAYIINERIIGQKETAYIYREMKPVIDQFKRWERQMQEWWRNVDHVKQQGVEHKILWQIYYRVQQALQGDDAVWRVYFARAIAKHRLRDLLFSAVLYTGIVYLVLSGLLALSIAVLVFFSFDRITRVLGDLNDQQRDVQFNLASVAKYRHVLSQVEPFTDDEGLTFTDETISVAFDRVTHHVTSNEGTKVILRDVSLQIPAGQSVGIVGPSSAGKSQLMSLLVRAIDPVAGSVLINDHDLRDLSRQSLLRYYGVIVQKSEPFEDTILGNLLFPISHLDLPVPYEEMTGAEQAAVCGRARLALQKAGLDPDSFEHGIHTNIGYKGLTLSGGQQQRLQIAAAHMKLLWTSARPRLILADEPTSSLDSLSELTVMEHLQDALPPNTTLLMVAHRLSTVANMDKIIFVRPLAQCPPNTPQVTMHDSLTHLYLEEALFREMADAQGYVPRGIVKAA